MYLYLADLLTTVTLCNMSYMWECRIIDLPVYTTTLWFKAETDQESISIKWHTCTYCHTWYVLHVLVCTCLWMMLTFSLWPYTATYMYMYQTVFIHFIYFYITDLISRVAWTLSWESLLIPLYGVHLWLLLCVSVLFI